MKMTYRNNNMKLACRYIRSLSRWIKSGRPIRNEEAVLDIFTTYCRNCDKYDCQGNHCIVCGCRVNTDAKPLSNKIAMATEQCPLEKW